MRKDEAEHRAILLEMVGFRGQGRPVLQQRVAIARALAMRPMVDEVTSALDPEVIGEVTTVFASSTTNTTSPCFHPSDGVSREIADRICFSARGRSLNRGPPNNYLYRS